MDPVISPIQPHPIQLRLRRHIRHVPRVLLHLRRARPAHRVPRPQRRRDALRVVGADPIVEEQSQTFGVLDGLRRALALERRHRVRCVADEDGAAAGVGWERVCVFDFVEVDALGVS